MHGIFNLENGFFQAMGKIVDIIFVSILWTFFSMPVITIGPATVALYYVVTKVIRKDRGYVFAEFWKCFKQNFVSGIIYTAIIIPITILLFINFTVINQRDTKVTMVLFYIYWLFLYLLVSTVLYLFPLQSRFSLKRLETVKMALFVSMKYLPKTLFIVFITVAGGMITWMVPLLTSFMPGIIALMVSLPLEKVMKKYLPKPDENIPEDELEWYYTL